MGAAASIARMLPEAAELSAPNANENPDARRTRRSIP